MGMHFEKVNGRLSDYEFDLLLNFQIENFY